MGIIQTKITTEGSLRDQFSADIDGHPIEHLEILIERPSEDRVRGTTSISVILPVIPVSIH